MLLKVKELQRNKIYSDTRNLALPEVHC